MCIMVLGVEYCFGVGVVGWWGQFFLLLVDSARDHQQGAGGHRESLGYLDSMAKCFFL